MTLFHLLRDAPEAWAPYEAEGTIFGSINKTQLEALRLPTVSEDLAEGLERKLDALETSIASYLEENVRLATMRDALLPQLMSGRIRVRDAEQMVGDVWEWTASDFVPYPGFRAFPYAEYSAVFFGPEYKVLRGGSWAVAPKAARNTFRNWDYPIRRQIFAGFRCARDA